MINKFEGIQRKRWCWQDLRYYACVCLEGLEKTTRNFSQNMWPLFPDLNPERPEYEAGVITIRLRGEPNE